MEGWHAKIHKKILLFYFFVDKFMESYTIISLTKKFR